MKRQKLREKNTSKGITLVALVITIIILLILAGVGINMAIDSDGIFSKAKEATEKWENAILQEQEAIEQILGSLPANWDESKVIDKVTDSSKNRTAPIPKGFVASQISGENTIASGLVIYEGTAPVTGVKGSEAHITAMTTRNQYVWVPVDDINQMLMCKLNNANDDGTICDLKLEGNNTGGYSLRCLTHNEDGENTTELCGRIYINGGTVNFDNRSQKWADAKKEPTIIDADTDDNTGGLEAFETKIVGDFENMAISVARYGGFYVARYEPGVNGVSKKNQQVITAAVDWSSADGIYVGVNGWYGLYNSLNRTIESNAYIKGHMIYGSQYDQIIKFLEEDSKNGPQVAHEDRQEPNQAATGSNEKDIMSNIYDLESNNRELLAQTDSRYRASRGSAYTSVANNQFYAASWYGQYSTANYQPEYTSRQVLYF